jgi:hypothetical protein
MPPEDARLAGTKVVMKVEEKHRRKEKGEESERPPGHRIWEHKQRYGWFGQAPPRLLPVRHPSRHALSSPLCDRERSNADDAAVAASTGLVLRWPRATRC